MLARIVDLERYQKLHGKADDKRRALKSELEGITNQLSGIKEVSEDEYAEVEARIVEVEATRTATQERIDGFNALELRARRWTDTQGKLTGVRTKLADAEKLLGTALAIEKDHTRLRELRDVLPAVNTIVTERGRMGESERKSEKLAKDREDTADRRRKTENALSQGRTKLGNLKKTQSEDEANKAKLETRLRELAGVLEKVKQVEDAEAEVSRLEAELKPLPADPDAAVRKLQGEQERLALLAQHVALLERLHQDRSELTKAVAGEKAARADEARLKADGLKAKEGFTKLEADAKAAREDRAAKDQAAAEARALARQARELADEFTTMSGQTKCRACGQPLTPGHFADEKKTREANAKAADAKLKALTDAALKAATREERADREGGGRPRPPREDARRVQGRRGGREAGDRRHQAAHRFVPADVLRAARRVQGEGRPARAGRLGDEPLPRPPRHHRTVRARRTASTPSSASSAPPRSRRTRPARFRRNSTPPATASPARRPAFPAATRPRSARSTRPSRARRRASSAPSRPGGRRSLRPRPRTTASSGRCPRLIATWSRSRGS